MVCLAVIICGFMTYKEGSHSVLTNDSYTGCGCGCGCGGCVHGMKQAEAVWKPVTAK